MTTRSRSLLSAALLVAHLSAPLASAASYPNGVSYVRQAGIMTGYPNGSFEENRLINRVEFAKVIVGFTMDASLISSCAVNSMPFNDVSRTTWYSKYVCVAYRYGFMEGYADGRFQPEAAIPFSEVSKVLAGAYNLGGLSSGGVWYRAYVEALATRGAIPLSISSPSALVTRGELAEMIYRLEQNIDDLPSHTYATLTDGNGSTVDDNDDSDDEDSDDADSESRNGLTLSIRADDDTVEPGDTVKYTVTLRSEDDDQEVDVAALFDRDFTFDSASDDGRRRDDNRVEWDEIELDEDKTESLTLTLDVDDSANDGDKLEVRVTSTDEDGDHITVSSMIEIDDDSNDDDNDDHDDDDLNLSVSTNDSSPDTGDTVTYTIKIRNDSNEDQHVDLEAKFDSDLEFVSATDEGDEIGTTRVEWQSIPVDEGETEEVTLKLKVSGDADEDDELEAVFTAEDRDGNDAQETEEITVGDDGNSDDEDDDELSLDVRVNDAKPMPGDTVQYTITLRNRNDSNQDMEISADFDDDLTFVSATDNGQLRSGNLVEWDDVRVDEDDSEVITLTLRVRADADDGDELDVVFRAEDEDNNDARETETIEVDTNNNDDDDEDDEDDDDVSVTVRADDTRPEEGDVVEYTVEVRNLSTSNDSFDIRADFDEDLNFVSASDGGDEEDDRIEWDNILIDKNDTEFLTFRLRVSNNANEDDRLNVRVRAENSDGDQDTDEEEVRVDN